VPLADRVASSRERHANNVFFILYSENKPSPYSPFWGKSKKKALSIIELMLC
jgi:hypothetical protein